MKLLLDQNISPKLALRLHSSYPETVHVRDAGLDRAADEDVWTFASEHGFTIVTKDSDFSRRAFLFGHPPKVIWIRTGNCSTDEIEGLLVGNRSECLRFQGDPDGSFLAIG